MTEQQPAEQREPTAAEVYAYLTTLEEISRQRRRAWWRLAFGLVIVVVAGLISLGTYATAGQEAARQAAETGSGSASYVVWWGPMAWGGWLTVTAAVRLWRLRG